MLALADSVEAGLTPIASSLPPHADLVAQALLANPTLRARSSLELAKLYSVRPSDALEAIAAIVALAAHAGRGALRAYPALERAIGPLSSTDTALSRFGAPSIAPPTVKENPIMRAVPFGAFRGRGYAASTAEGAFGDAGSMTNDTALDGAGQNVVNMADVCTMNGTVANFQSAWNTTTDSQFGSPSLAVDDKYGPKTAAALGTVMGSMRPACPAFTVGPAPNPVTPNAPTAPVAPLQAGPGGGGLMSAQVFGIPLVALLAGGVGVWLLRRKKGKRR